MQELLVPVLPQGFLRLRLLRQPVLPEPYSVLEWLHGQIVWLLSSLPPVLRSFLLPP